MQLNPYLNFNGNCDAAFKFYEKVLGGKIVLKMTYGETPDGGGEQCPPSSKDHLAHVRLEAPGLVLMGSDCPPGYFEKAQGVTLSLTVDKLAEAERLYNALKENGVVKMALAKTFWAAGFAMVTDQFGTPWMINCEKET
ncbi:MAG: VOC family protein [Collimonas sp.]|uniref:VOC family protein n=1 Tax=Collimonas sp. TaxID=1963772 RepID=UPI003266CB45